MISEKVVIIGGSHGGIAVIETLRREGFRGKITLISDEAVPLFSPTALPYLYNKKERQTRLLRTSDFYRGIEVIEARASAIDTEKSFVRLPGKKRVHYDRLVLATGASALPLPLDASPEIPVFLLRRLQDMEKIERAAKKSRNILIVGAGLIGLHLAQIFAGEGRHVHVVELREQLLPELVHPELAGVLKALLEKAGIHFSLGAGLSGVRDGYGFLSSGEKVKADMAIAAIGIRPNLEVVAGTPIAVNRAIIVNEQMETNVPGIYACGDAVEFRDSISGESRPNPNVVSAAEQGKIAAECIAGKKVAHPGVISINAFNCLGMNLFSLGRAEVDAGDRLYEERSPDAQKEPGALKRVLFRDGRLKGMVLFNIPVDGGIYYRLMKEKADLKGLEEKILADPFIWGRWIAERYFKDEPGIEKQ